MGVFCFTVVFLALVCIAEPKLQSTKAEETNRDELYARLEKRVLALERAQEETKSDISTQSLMQNDTSLEERVQALEFQMENVHEDMTVIEGEISVINSEQDLQDTQLQIIEEDVQEVTAVTDDLQMSVTSLQETDAGLLEDITQLTEVDGSLDSRLSKLEVGGAVAFHVALGTYSSIPINSVVLFPNVNVNLGEGYNAETGQFVTSSGGAGLYYFYVHVLVGSGKFAWINIRHNGINVAMMNEDENLGGDVPSGSCGAVIMMEEGK